MGLQSDPTERYHFHVLVITLSILMSSLGPHATLPGWWSGYPTSTLGTKLRTHFLAWLFGPWWEIVLGKEVETHSSILAWKTPWTEEPGEL